MSPSLSQRLPESFRIETAVGEQAGLERCLTLPEAEISTNAVKRAIRPLKLPADHRLGNCDSSGKIFASL